MKDPKLAHDIKNAIERLRIMYDIACGKDYSAISKEEIKIDLKNTLIELEEKLLVLID